MKKIKRMCFFLIKGSFTLLHSGLSPLDPFSFFFKKNNPFLPFSPGLTCHLVVFQEHMTSDFDSNLAALTNTNSYCLSRASSPLPTQTRLFFFFFFLSLSLCFSLYLCTVGGRQRKPHGLAFGMRRHDRQKEIERKCHDKKNKKKKAALKKTSPEEDL